MNDNQNKKIKKRIYELMQENKYLLNVGDKYMYSMNCNQLKGISFVLEALQCQ